jgi:hypothetical protein
MFLYKINSLNEGIIEIRNDVELVLEELGANYNPELLMASNWQRLAPG